MDRAIVVGDGWGVNKDITLIKVKKIYLTLISKFPYLFMVFFGI